MKERGLGFLLVAPLLLLAACGKSNAPVAAEPTESVATVNGKAISKADFDKYVDDIQRQAGQPITPDQRTQLLDQYISLRLAAEAADKDGIAKKPEVAKDLDQARMNVLVDAEIKKYLEEHPVTDAELKPEYDAQVAAMPHEYHARHILVDDKATADQITKDLKGGADFAKLAAQKSKDPSGKNGGDLGWFTPDSMVKPFAEAVQALKPGQMTDQPVQSQFGWHIIKLEESRAASAPAFDDVKDRVRQMVQRKRVQTYLEDLRKNAKIEKKS
jgi:peptidyl-prolyl cis-trans isomerase C